MNKIQIGLIGYGNVGSGVAAFLQKYRTSIRQKTQTDIILRGVCDRSIAQKKTEHLGKIVLTDKAQDILTLPDVDVIVELIGGVKAAKEIVVQALRSGKHVVTANKELIANEGPELFALAHQNNCNIYYESSVMAGVPVIRMVTEGIAGNQVNGLYGIINGTCNFILSKMTRDKVSFEQALLEAQQKGFAESDPTLDINGMDSANKLGILVLLTMGKHILPKDIHTEGITHISHDDIEHAESLGLVIKLLAIAKRHEEAIEIRVHPTLFTQDHPLASINGVLNAVFINTTPLGSILLSGKGAGQMPAASGIISDLIHLASRQQSPAEKMLANLAQDDPTLTIQKMDHVLTRFYLRFMTTDKPGVLANITGILGNHGISINSVSQKAHNKIASVPVIMLTDYAPEKDVRQALKEIQQLPVVKAKPVAIRMENLT